jgi:hypothetical protein
MYPRFALSIDIPARWSSSIPYWDFSSLPKTTPPVIRVFLERCLDHDAKTRLQAIGEARIAIDRLIPVRWHSYKDIPRTDINSRCVRF